MHTYIALLRGINVGGHRKIPMADLRDLLTNSGLETVQTYIQTGNVIFQSLEENIQILQVVIQKSIANHFGFEVPVIIKTRSELQAVFDKSPFSIAEKEKSYFAFLSCEPKIELIDEMQKVTYENEAFLITKNCIYFYAEKGYGQAKFNLKMFERKLKVIATARNYKTMLKLLSLSQN